ncbi:glycosylphosphatidylinositol anchor biosynthesis [Tulasnella sp. JGI-2019a]|nr:glycosylphosphatidylinositol anchor biosynthesis [Tulasnella sp. JGI-2019a]
MRIEALIPFIIWPLVAVLTQTFFQSEEFYQALESAHHVVFGYGHLTWEWMSDLPVRSIAYPALWIPVYQALKMTGFDSGSLLILAPKALGGVLAAVKDLYVWRFASRWGREYGRVALFFSLLSSFNALALSRILSSSLETSLTIAALFYWPFVPSQINHRDLPLSLSFAAFSCLIRPTGAVIWVFLWHSLLFSARHHPQWVSIVGDTFSVGRAAFILLAIDTLYYKKLTFTPWNFIRVNLSSLSSSYGSQPSHDYIARALPVVCGTYFPWFPWITRNGGLSTHYYPSSTCWPRNMQSTNIAAASKGKRTELQGGGVSLIIYVMFFHSRAQIAVMHHVRSIPPEELRSVGFLMPCYSAPMHAYLHRPEVEVWAIGCSPPLSGQALDTYRDQISTFDNPTRYLTQQFPPSVDPSFSPSLLPASKPGDSLMTT